MDIHAQAEREGDAIERMYSYRPYVSRKKANIRIGGGGFSLSMKVVKRYPKPKVKAKGESKPKSKLKHESTSAFASIMK